jgi:S-phase kinase-associated protein 1
MSAPAPTPAAAPAITDENVSMSLDAPVTEGSIKLVSKDGKDFTVERKYAFLSNLIRTTLESDAAATEMPLPGVTGDVLTKVIEFMNHHKGDEPKAIEKPLRSKVMKDVCKDSWDAEYIDKIGEDRAMLYAVVLAANYLDVKSLLHLGTAKVASLIKGQPLDKIKSILSGKDAAGSAASSSAASASAAAAASPAIAAQ